MELNPDGRPTTRQLTWSLDPAAFGAWGGAPSGNTASWPCWSPDGSSIACFVDGTDNSLQTCVAVFEVDGVHEFRFDALPERMPIHVQWSPDGQRLGVLVQFEDQLELWVAEARPAPGPLRLVAEGSPLFFSWADNGRRVLLHVGDGDDQPARIEVRDVVGDADDIVFRVPPANFCVPFAVPATGEERVLYVIRRDDASQVVSARLDGEDVLGLAVLPGLVALVPSADGQQVATTSAPDADGSPYEGVRTIACDGFGAPSQWMEGPNLAFFWPAALEGPMWVQWDAGRQNTRWMWGSAPKVARELGRFRPTRDQYFHFHFFEQFARSHSLVSPDGRWVVWAGHAADDTGAGPSIFLTDLHDESGSGRPVCAGSYAVFAPA